MLQPFECLTRLLATYRRTDRRGQRRFRDHTTGIRDQGPQDRQRRGR